MKRIVFTLLVALSMLFTACTPTPETPTPKATPGLPCLLHTSNIELTSYARVKTDIACSYWEGEPISFQYYVYGNVYNGNNCSASFIEIRVLWWESEDKLADVSYAYIYNLEAKQATSFQTQPTCSGWRAFDISVSDIKR